MGIFASKSSSSCDVCNCTSVDKHALCKTCWDSISERNEAIINKSTENEEPNDTVKAELNQHEILLDLVSSKQQIILAKDDVIQCRDAMIKKLQESVDQLNSEKQKLTKEIENMKNQLSIQKEQYIKELEGLKQQKGTLEKGRIDLAASFNNADNNKSQGLMLIHSKASCQLGPYIDTSNRVPSYEGPTTPTSSLREPYTQKHLSFVMGGSNTTLAGIGPVYGGRLADAGYGTAQSIFEMYLALNRDKSAFQSWMRNTCNSNIRWSAHTYHCLDDWYNSQINK